MGAVRGLECSGCRETFEGSRLSAVCPECQSPLLAQYDLEALRTRLTADVVGRR
jgi:Zn finger protein HypA/HybF involved in hydrogenase expression